MTDRLRKLALGFGIGAIASCLFTFVKNAQFGLLTISGAASVVMLVGGLTAVVGAVRRTPMIVIAAGALLLLAALLELIQLVAGGTWFGGDAGTLSAFLGFGLFLGAIGFLATLPDPTPTPAVAVGVPPRVARSEVAARSNRPRTPARAGSKRKK